MASQHGPPVQFTFSAKFSKNRHASLSTIEFRALKLLIGEEPEIGAKLLGSLNSRSLDFAGCVIYYSYEPIFQSVCFMEVEKVDWNSTRSPNCLRQLRNLFGI